MIRFFKTRIISGCEGRGDAEQPYLTRYTLIETSRWQLCLHLFHRSDHPVLHDHPWAFASLLLWPGYLEVTPDGPTRYGPGRLLVRPADWVHRVQLLRRLDGTDRRALTLVLMGKRRREWGFHEPAGWTHWRAYFERLRCRTLVK